MTAPDLTQDPAETPNVTQMRETIERQTAEVKELKGQLKTQAFEAAGLDPSKGIGELLANAYDGDFTKEAVVEFAKSKEVEVTTDAKTDPANLSPEQKLITAGQKRIDEAHSQSDPLTSTPSIDDDIAKADADGDFKLGIRLRNAKQLGREQSGEYVIGQ